MWRKRPGIIYWKLLSVVVRKKDSELSGGEDGGGSDGIYYHSLFIFYTF